MHEDLLGYLLGALDPHEMDRVARLLREDPSARRELEKIERALRPLEENCRPPESPPVDLVARTLGQIPPLEPPSSQASVPQSDSSPVRGETGIDRITDSASHAEPAIAGLNSGVEPPIKSEFTWADWCTGAVSAAVLLSLLLPSLAEGRFQARKNACQDQLRQFGTALTQFVFRDEQSRLPAVAREGPEAFSGVFVHRLQEAGLLTDLSGRWCPSLGPPDESEMHFSSLTELASIDELHHAPIDRLGELQRFAGGHYAYTLGVFDDQRFSSPRFESRSSFAIMSDAPSSRFASSGLHSIAHGGVGVNVLYEDGRVQFVPVSSLDSIPDHPWMNHRGEVEAGVNVDDASLAPSWCPPFTNVKQRW